jgi:hypothetical protein
LAFLTVKINSLSEFLVAVEKASHQMDCHTSDVWYRGVSDESYNLLPGIKWRRIDEIKHRGMVNEFLTNAVQYQDIGNLPPFELYALMQHYGLPTRLLDWSLSPLTALYFSLEKDENENRRVVWALNPTRLNKIAVNADAIIYPHDAKQYDNYNLEGYLPISLRNVSVKSCEKPIAILVKSSNKRIASQQGAFTIHGSGSEKIDDMFTDDDITEIVKFEINGKDVRDSMLMSLRTINIREDTIYQDLNALSIRIAREYS